MGKCMHTIHVRGIDVLLLRLKVISSYVRPPESRNENDRLHYHRKGWGEEYSHGGSNKRQDPGATPVDSS